MKFYLIMGILIALVIYGYIKMYNKLQKLFVKVSEGSSDIDVALEKRYDLLSEELETVKKYLAHEYEVYTGVTSLRTGNELSEKKFEEQKSLSKEAIETIDKAITSQQKEMEQIKKYLDKSQHSYRNRVKSRQKPSGPNKNNLDDVSSKADMMMGQKINMLASAEQSLNGVGTAVNALAEQYPVLYSYISVEHFQNSIKDSEEHLQAARRLYNSNASYYNQTIATFPYLLVAKIHGMEKADFYEVEDNKREFKVDFN